MPNYVRHEAEPEISQEAARALLAASKEALRLLKRAGMGDTYTAMSLGDAIAAAAHGDAS